MIHTTLFEQIKWYVVQYYRLTQINKMYRTCLCFNGILREEKLNYVRSVILKYKLLKSIFFYKEWSKRLLENSFQPHFLSDCCLFLFQDRKSFSCEAFSCYGGTLSKDSALFPWNWLTFLIGIYCQLHHVCMSSSNYLTLHWIVFF